MNGEIIDIFDILTEDETQADEVFEILPIDEALFTCLNTYGYVNIEYISNRSGLPAKKVISELRGTIFQNPEAFLDGKEYDIFSEWELSSKYLSGNIRKKLSLAREANKKSPKVFESNLEKLKAILPEKVDIDDIHISLGASWIPLYEIQSFITKFLNLKHAPQVSFSPDLMTYKITETEESRKSVLNTITYGVKDEIKGYGGTYSKQYLTAIDIIEQTMNAKTIKVFDYLPKTTRWTYEYDPVLNQAKTIEAQEKQKIITDAFLDYVYSSKARMAMYENFYNEKLVGYTYSQYDGNFLKLSDLNPEVTLFKHQRDAIARVLLSGGNLLFAHDVGTGKTFEMIVSVHELYRMGLSQKNLIVVPNNILKATVDAHRYLYKNDKVLVIYPRDFTPQNRNKILEEIRDSDFTAIYMAYSSFDMIVMSKDYYVNKMTNEIRELNAAVYNANTRYYKSTLLRKADALRKRLTKYIMEEDECEWLTYDKLGITTLVVDEAHNYKNIPIQTRADGIVGMGGSSKKCREMLEKAHFTDRLIMATGTPLTNSLADLFTFQTYLQPSTLEYHKAIRTF